MDPIQRIARDWRGHQSPAGAISRMPRSVPLSVKDLVSDSGWRDLDG